MRGTGPSSRARPSAGEGVCRPQAEKRCACRHSGSRTAGRQIACRRTRGTKASASTSRGAARRRRPQKHRLNCAAQPHGQRTLAHARSAGHHEHLRCVPPGGCGCAAITLPFVPFADALDAFEQRLVAQSVCRLLDHVHGDQAFVDQQPEIVQVPQLSRTNLRPLLLQLDQGRRGRPRRVWVVSAGRAASIAASAAQCACARAAAHGAASAMCRPESR